jgi:pimeloyl-ACP methyl ester carboxylesterase
MSDRVRTGILAGLLLLGLASCDQPDNGAQVVAASNPPLIAEFDPGNSVIPFPSNLLFTGTLDGTLNIPFPPGTTPADPANMPIVAMNTLDGFSTIAPISTKFSAALNSATILPGQTVRLFEVTTSVQGAVTGVVAELIPGLDYFALVSPTDSTQKTLVIKPLRPLNSNAQYMVVLTSGIKSTSGFNASPSTVFSLLKGTTPLVDVAGKTTTPLLTDAEAQQLEPLRQLTQTMLLAAAGQGIPQSSVVLTWTFKTQTLGTVLAAIRANSLLLTPPAPTVVDAPPSPLTGGLGRLDIATFAIANGLDPLLFPNVGSVVIGAVPLPYYLQAAANPQDTAPLTGFFQFAPGSSVPTVQSTQTVPFLLTTPNTPAPPGGWPVVIFQHGFTVDKSVVMGIANTLAQAGFATIAIDSVLHGDRTFGLDLVTEILDPITGDYIVTAEVPDGVPDSSGRHYLNLASFLTFRDNIRQSVADLIHLTRMLEAQAVIDVVNNTTGAPGADGLTDIWNAGFKFVGHSNGGILGTLYMAVEPSVTTAVLANPGGIYSDIARNSTEISPLVLAGLAAQGIFPGSSEFDAFFVAAQTVLDDGDPINYGSASVGKNILLQKTTPDAVVPNASTDALIGVLGLPQVGFAAGNSPFPGSGFVNLIQGDHSSFLSPAASLAATTEMQTETAIFLTTGVIQTNDPLVVE